MPILPKLERLVRQLGDVLLLDLDPEPGLVGNIHVAVLDLPIVLDEFAEPTEVRRLLDEKVVEDGVDGEAGSVVQRAAGVVGRHEHLRVLGSAADLECRRDAKTVTDVRLEERARAAVDL